MQKGGNDGTALLPWKPVLAPLSQGTRIMWTSGTRVMRARTLALPLPYPPEIRRQPVRTPLVTRVCARAYARACTSVHFYVCTSVPVAVSVYQHTRIIDAAVTHVHVLR